MTKARAANAQPQALEQLPEAGRRAPWMCDQGWRTFLLQRAQGFVFLDSIAGLRLCQAGTALALIFYHDGQAIPAA